MSGAQVPAGDLAAHWRDVTSAVRLTERRVEQVLEGSGIPAQWFPVLDLLLRSEDHRLPMSVLARGLSMTSGGFTKLADRMAREQLIDRRGSAADRRVVYATLTAEGLGMAQRATQLHQDALQECLSGVVDADQLASAAAAMRALNTAHADSVQADSVRGDSVQADSVQADSVQADSVQGNSVQGDSVQGGDSAPGGDTDEPFVTDRTGAVPDRRRSGR